MFLKRNIFKNLSGVQLSSFLGSELLPWPSQMILWSLSLLHLFLFWWACLFTLMNFLLVLKLLFCSWETFSRLTYVCRFLQSGQGRGLAPVVLLGQSGPDLLPDPPDRVQRGSVPRDHVGGPGGAGLQGRQEAALRRCYAHHDWPGRDQNQGQGQTLLLGQILVLGAERSSEPLQEPRSAAQGGGGSCRRQEVEAGQSGQTWTWTWTRTETWRDQDLDLEKPGPDQDQEKPGSGPGLAPGENPSRTETRIWTRSRQTWSRMRQDKTKTG